MDELEFIREYMAVMCCSERSAVGVFIVHDALVEESQPLWLDEPASSSATNLDEISPAAR